MPWRTEGSARTSMPLNLTPRWLRIWTTAAEKPHCGKTGLPSPRRSSIEISASGRLSLISRSIVAASIAIAGSLASALAHIARQPGFVRGLEFRDRYGTGAGECQRGSGDRTDALRVYTLIS